MKASLGELDPIGLMTQLALATAHIQQLEQRLEETQQQDLLTGLPNRLRLLDRTDQAIMLAPRWDHLVALLFVEVERFKAVNQILGFAEADELWLQFSRRLASPLKQGDTLAKLANDQYAILLPEVRDTLEPCRVAQGLLDALKTPSPC